MILNDSWKNKLQAALIKSQGLVCVVSVISWIVRSAAKRTIHESHEQKLRNSYLIKSLLEFVWERKEYELELNSESR